MDVGLMTWQEFITQIKANGWRTVTYSPNDPDTPIEAYTGTAVGKRWEGGVVSDVDHTAIHADRQEAAAERQDRDIAKTAFARLDQIIANADTATTTQLRGAIADLARMVKALGRRELAD